MYTLILLNGGVGGRVGAGVPKQFVEVDSVPMVVHALRAAAGVTQISQVVMNYPAGWRQDIQALVERSPLRVPVRYVEAGATRQESVCLMLPHCTNDKILMHESARPLVQPDDFLQLIDDPRDNVSFMMPLACTVAPVSPSNDRVVGYLDRASLRDVRMPQKFRRDALVAAHDHAADHGLSFTEDATMCAVTGSQVYFVDGAERNFKVTTMVDVAVANFLLAGWPDPRAEEPDLAATG